MSDFQGEPTIRRSLWRSVGAPVLIVLAIVAALWYLDGGVVPFASDSDASRSVGDYRSDEDSPDALDIKLGPLDDTQAELDALAPDFTLRGLDGKPVTLSSFRGKTVLINFWASWCVPCRQETPDLQQAYLQRADDGLVVVGVNLRESKAQAGKFTSNYGVTYPILLDLSGDVAKAYRLTGLPESWIVDPAGVLRQRKIGAFTSAQLDTILDGVLPQAQNSR